jgi:two-component system, chemotaxis family, CheB/CheR fusion protein
MTRQRSRRSEEPSLGPESPPVSREADETATIPNPDTTPSGGSKQTRVSPPTVGIGASAGGLDAFQRLLHRLKPNTGMAYVLVQHLDPEHESLLPELLGRASAIPVVQAVDGMPLRVDHAYVIPPNRTMTVIDGHLRLVARGKGRGLHLPIDTFLRSLAEVHGSGAVGVILSGAGSDGSRGIEAIKEAGGITMAQDSASAQIASMPEHAVETGAVDFVLEPEEIADQLARVGAHLASDLNGDGAVGSGTGALPNRSDEGALRKIVAILEQRTGVDFQHYRRGTLHRRILRRMLVHRQETHTEYLAHLRLDPAELDVLYEELLIGVTRFFRDPDVFAALHASALPAMLEGHAPGTPIRVWVPGCATGEEAYSIAMALLERLDDAGRDIPIQIFGTDLSEASIATARAGVYPKTIAADVSPERLRRFFVDEAGGYRIAKSLRDLCVFSRHNVVRDPPFAHLDLVSCRNVFIYLEPELQRRALAIFHYALEVNGILLLGAAESIGAAPEYFEAFDKPYRIFQRHATARRSLDLDFTTPASVPVASSGRRVQVRTPTAGATVDLIVEAADRQVFAQFTPPAVVINAHMEIVQLRGDTAGFLALTPGLASLDLLKLARPELVMPLRSAIRQADTGGQPVRETGISLIDDTVVRRVDIAVHPFQPRSASGRFFAVIFTAHSATTSVGGAGSKKTVAKRSGRGKRVDAAAHEAVQEELAATKRYLRDVIEQHEGATEELRAAAEEIQSSNEELQSTNEELETTKEEVQSTNEELTTLNEELRHRNRELIALSGDVTNFLGSTTIPIVFVGADLRIRRFTPATQRVMRVVDSDANRLLGDIKLRVALPDLEREILSVIETLVVIDQEIQDDEGRWWALTIRPYQTIDRRVDGAVLVFADIDAVKRYGERADEVARARQELVDVAEAGRTAADDARRVAEDANRVKSTFLASVSHDLRTPLNAITGYTELLEQGVRGPLSEAQLSDLARIRRSSRYLLALINDILNFAKVEAGHLDVRLVDLPVAPLVAELHELIAPQLMAQTLDLARSSCEVVVRADPEKLRQILLNLFSNALKFTPPDGHIGVECIATDAVVRIEVWDTGRGIPAAQVEDIFQPFVQIDRGLTSPPPGGVGLGLSISRHLARAMGGDLTVTSTVGEGSRFALTLQRVILTEP